MAKEWDESGATFDETPNGFVDRRVDEGEIYPDQNKFLSEMDMKYFAK